MAMAVLPAPCRAGLTGHSVCTALPGLCSGLLGLLRPSFCRASQHCPAQQPVLGKQERALGSADGFVSFLRCFLRVGSGGGLSQSLGVAVPLAASPGVACPTFPVPACPQPLHLACFKGLAHAWCLGYCLEVLGSDPC